MVYKEDSSFSPFVTIGDSLNNESSWMINHHDLLRRACHPMDAAAPPSSQQSSTSSASAAASTEETASFESCAWKQDSVLSFVNSRNSIVATEHID